MPEFTFIDNSSSIINRGSKRAIRSHVMRGKNIGKKRSVRGCSRLEKKTTELPPLLEIAKRRGKMPYESDATPQMLIQIGDTLSGMSYAGEFVGNSKKNFILCKAGLSHLVICFTCLSGG